MDFTLRKSFKSHGSYKQSKKISAGGGNSDHEELPILSDHRDEEEEEEENQRRHYRQPNQKYQFAGKMTRDRNEVIVKMDEANGEADSRASEASINGGGKFWRENKWKESDGESFHFEQSGKGSSPEARENEEDPPSRLIGQFLHKQRASGDFTLDMDLEMDELRRGCGGGAIAGDRNLSPVPESPAKVSNGEAQSAPDVEISKTESVRRRFKDSPESATGDDTSQGSSRRDDEVVRCTSNASFQRELTFQRASSLLRVKTKSRLLDPPEEPDRRSGRVPKPRSGQVPRSGMVQRSGPMKSGFLGNNNNNNNIDEDDDPFMDEDLPDEFKRSNLSALTLLQWASLVLIVGALACTLSIPFLRHKNLWKLKLWKWEVLVLVLICGRLVSGWGIRIVVFFIERNFLLRKRVLYFVYGVRKAVQNCLWLGLVLIAWHFLFDKKVERETRSEGLQYVTKVLVCFLIGTLLWLVKTLMVKVLASSFHVSTYFDRIQDSLFNQFVIETLSGPPLVEIQRTEKEKERLVIEVERLEEAGANLPPDLERAVLPNDAPKASRLIGSGRLHKAGKNGKLSRAPSIKSDEGITIDHLHKLNPKNVSAWNMKRLMKIVRHGTLTTLDEQIVDSTHEDESAMQIRSEVEAKAAAKKIFQNVARPGSKFIHPEDLLRFMREDEALKAMSLFEGASESKKISKSSLKNWVVNAFRERRALALTLNDTKTAVNKLHHMVNIIIAIIIGVIWLLVLGIATSKFLLFVSSQLVLVAFIFGNTCKTVFEAIVFLFVMHPFDVGDRCEIDGVQMVVEEMNILTTVFLRFDNAKIIFPNSVLATKPINNFYRSPDMGDGVEFSIHVATPADKISAVRQRITNYVENKKEHWYPAPMVIMKELEDLNRVRMAVWLCHKMNHQDMGERHLRRSLLIEEMVKIFKELDIQYRLLPIDINVRAMPTVTSTRLPSNWSASAS